MRIARALVLCLLPSLATVPVVHAQPVAQVELLHAFRAAPGNPVGGLARAADGSFYGLTARLLYRIAPGGAMSVAHTFDASATGAGAPTIAPDGIVYGDVTQANRVAVFRFDPATSAFRVLHTFDTASDGQLAAGRARSDEAQPRHRPRRAAVRDDRRGLVRAPRPRATARSIGSIRSPARATTVHEFSGAAPALRNPVGGLVEARRPAVRGGAIRGSLGSRARRSGTRWASTGSIRRPGPSRPCTCSRGRLAATRWSG